MLLLMGGIRLWGASVTVFAAASLSDALVEIGKGYETNKGVKVVFNFGASSFLARQIQEGAPADIFFSADEEKMNGLQSKGLVVSGTRTNLLSNSLVIVVAAERGAKITRAGDLVSPQVKRIAIAEPETVPAGIYAKGYLEKEGLWQQLAKKIVPTENVRAALSAVEVGNAEAGIVYKTDAAISRKVKVAVEVPASTAPEITYPVAVMKDAPNSLEANKFISYLASSEGLNVFRKHGFIVRNE